MNTFIRAKNMTDLDKIECPDCGEAMHESPSVIVSTGMHLEPCKTVTFAPHWHAWIDPGGDDPDVKVMVAVGPTEDEAIQTLGNAMFPEGDAVVAYTTLPKVN